MIEVIAVSKFEERFRFELDAKTERAANVETFFDLQQNSAFFGYWFHCYAPEHFLLALSLSEMAWNAIGLPATHIIAAEDIAANRAYIVILMPNIRKISNDDHQFADGVLNSAKALLSRGLFHGDIHHDCFFVYNDRTFPIGFGAQAECVSRHKTLAEKCNFDAFTYLGVLSQEGSLPDGLMLTDDVSVEGVPYADFDPRVDYIRVFNLRVPDRIGDHSADRGVI